MTGWAADVGRWLFFLLVLFLVEVSIATYFRALSNAFKDQDSAQSAGTGLLSVFILFSGYFVLTIPVWLAWIKYISPFYWAIT
jgi:ABC-type multidrug transport system permease subunit